jgi:hypothetical protein
VPGRLSARAFHSLAVGRIREAADGHATSTKTGKMLLLQYLPLSKKHFLKTTLKLESEKADVILPHGNFTQEQDYSRSDFPVVLLSNLR